MLVVVNSKINTIIVNDTGSNPYETFTQSNGNVTSAINTSGLGIARLSISLESGIRYRITGTPTGTISGTKVIVSSDSNGSLPVSVNETIVSGNPFIVEFTAQATDDYLVVRSSSTSDNFAIADFNLTQLGATLVIDPKDASPIMVKSSVNQIEGLVTGATLENASLDHVYQDIYRAIADNGTFNVPVGCAFLEILINTTTLQAATNDKNRNGGRRSTSCC
jgi:hypothetical protein